MLRMYRLTIYKNPADLEDCGHIYLSANEKGELTITHDDMYPENLSELEEMSKEETRKIRRE